MGQTLAFSLTFRIELASGTAPLAAAKPILQSLNRDARWLSLLCLTTLSMAWAGTTMHMLPTSCAAEAMGHEIVLATHVDFQAPTDLPKSWQLLPVFTRDAYRGFSVFDGNEKSLRSLTSLHPESRSVGKRTLDWLQTTFDLRNFLRAHRRRVRQHRKHRRQLPKSARGVCPRVRTSL